MLTCCPKFTASEDIRTYKVVSVVGDQWKGIFVRNSKVFDFNKRIVNDEPEHVRIIDSIIREVYGGFFHSSDDMEYINFILAHNNGGKVFECTIPKGAEYYTDGNGSFASREIIVHK